MIILYFLFTALMFGFSAIIVNREIYSRSDFKIAPFRGTYNIYRYYVHLKKKNEKLSLGFKVFIAANINLGVCCIIWVVYFLG